MQNGEDVDIVEDWRVVDDVEDVEDVNIEKNDMNVKDGGGCGGCGGKWRIGRVRVRVGFRV